MKYRLRFANETDFDTRALRKLTLACLKRYADNDRVWRVNVRVQRKNGLRVGQAWINSGKWEVLIPQGTTKISGRWFAHIAQHEIRHCQGVRGERDMAKWATMHESHFDWADAHDMRIKEKEIKAKVPLQQKRAEHAQRMLDKHERRLKAQQRIVRKWRDKVSYYEKVTARKAAKKGT